HVPLFLASSNQRQFAQSRAIAFRRVPGSNAASTPRRRGLAFAIDAARQLVHSQEHTMKHRTIALMAGALVMALGATNTLQAKPKSFEVAFDKCFARREDGDPYLFTFAGPVSGDISGTVEASVLNDIRPGVEPNQ